MAAHPARIPALLLVVGACEREPAPLPKPVIVDAAPIDAAIIGPKLPPPSTPPWVMRQLDVGMVPFPQRAETFTLRRASGRASLEIAAQKAISKDLLNVSGWEPATVTTYVGTVTEAGTITIDVSHGAETLHLVCKPATEKAAPAGAVRKPGSRRGRECGDEGHWVPPAATSIDVLRCDVPERRYGEAPYLAFAPAPGIEWVYVNDDCAMQGGGWRLIPADGSIAPFRGG